MSRPAPLADADLTDRQLAMLTRLAEIGMEIAEAAGRRAAQGVGTEGVGMEGGGADGFDPGLSYARAARAVRLTIALQSRLAKDRLAQDREATQARAAEAARRRDRIHRRVEKALDAEHDDADEVEQLSSAVWESLTDVEDDDLAGRPVAEVVARICRELGLAAPFGRPADDRAPAPPGSPVRLSRLRGRSPPGVGEDAPPTPGRASSSPPRPHSCSPPPG